MAVARRETSRLGNSLCNDCRSESSKPLSVSGPQPSFVPINVHVKESNKLQHLSSELWPQAYVRSWTPCFGINTNSHRGIHTPFTPFWTFWPFTWTSSAKEGCTCKVHAFQLLPQHYFGCMTARLDRTLITTSGFALYHRVRQKIWYSATF